MSLLTSHITATQQVHTVSLSPCVSVHFTPYHHTTSTHVMSSCVSAHFTPYRHTTSTHVMSSCVSANFTYHRHTTSTHSVVVTMCLCSLHTLPPHNKYTRDVIICLCQPHISPPHNKYTQCRRHMSLSTQRLTDIQQVHTCCCYHGRLIMIIRSTRAPRGRRTSLSIAWPSRYGVVLPRAPDIIAIFVLLTQLSHYTISRQHHQRLPPNAASVEEQGEHYCRSKPIRRISS